MNTSAVAKLLSVSPSTVQRWVKQLELQMERNELGHYFFTDEDIELLKDVQDQLNKGISLQDVTVAKQKVRQGSIKAAIVNSGSEKLTAKLTELEQKINQKADDVVTYQLLQHRREIEELQNEIAKLTLRIQELENKTIKKNNSSENLLVFDQQPPQKKVKKKNIITGFFGF